MPELPAMENFCLEIQKQAVGKTICETHARKDRVVKDDATILAHALNGKKINECLRHGKYVFLRADAGKSAAWLAFHCGMTGYFTFPAKAADADLAKAKIALMLSDGSALAFFDPRRFGRVELIVSPEDFIEKHKLGTDALAVSMKDFLTLLENSRKPLKTFFLDQSLIAGIGNVYGDEIPFQARLSPLRKAQSMTAEEGKSLFKEIGKVFKLAIRKKAYLDHWDMLPKNWLVHYRDEGAECPRCASPIKSYTSGGRDGYYCAGCQK